MTPRETTAIATFRARIAQHERNLARLPVGPVRDKTAKALATDRAKLAAALGGDLAKASAIGIDAARERSTSYAATTTGQRVALAQATTDAPSTPTSPPPVPSPSAFVARPPPRKGRRPWILGGLVAAGLVVRRLLR